MANKSFSIENLASKGIQLTEMSSYGVTKLCYRVGTIKTMKIAEKRLIYGNTTFLIESRPSEGHVITRKQLNWITSSLLRMDQTNESMLLAEKSSYSVRKSF